MPGAPAVSYATLIGKRKKKLASLKVEEFDLRLDEGMVRWAQGLADRLMWTLVAEGRADEMETWRLPEEAFCSSQVIVLLYIYHFMYSYFVFEF